MRSALLLSVCAGLAGAASGQFSLTLLHNGDGVRNNIRGKETNLGNLIGDAFLYSANLRAVSFGLAAADVAFANGGGIRNNNVLPAGSFTELDSFDVLPFLNFLSIIESVSPERLKLIAENAYGSITADFNAWVRGFNLGC